MAQQKFIAYINDKHGKMITFERFSCTKVETVKAQMNKLFANDLYRVCTKGASTIDIYATPDGYTKEPNPIFTMQL